MDTEAIAREIVTIRMRLQEIDRLAGTSLDREVRDERERLEERKAHLQAELTAGEGLESERHTSVRTRIPPL